MRKKGSKGDFYHSLQAITVIPVLCLGIIITLFTYGRVSSAMHDIVKNELANICQTVIIMYDHLYPGDYALVGDYSYDLMKGDHVLTGEYDVIDQLKAETGMDITLFYYDTRILTTLTDSEGNRIIGTGASSRVLNEVLAGKCACFYTNASINGDIYFAYYSPLYNSDGSLVGMMYVGEPSAQVSAAVWKVVCPIILIALLAILIVSIATSYYTRQIISVLQKIRLFLSKVATGNLSESIDSQILRRNDELGEMATSAMQMQRSLRTLIEQDTLTELNNRRTGDKRLRQVQNQAASYHIPFAVCIGDIDLFKRINDTYGHECGDEVLRQIAGVLKRNMAGKGFVARWGGEEFLLVFTKYTAQEAYPMLQQIATEIQELHTIYENEEVHVTMTFGLTDGGFDTDIKTLLRSADEKLYHGKENGRNQIVK